MSGDGRAIDDRLRAEIIDATLDRLRRHYILPDVAQEVAAAVRGRADAGAYAAIVEAEALCAALTADLRELSRDKHVGLLFDPVPRPVRDGGEPDPAEWAERHEASRLDNYGFYRVERLAGNVSYLDLRRFAPPSVGGETAVAAMALLAHSSALIVDLRRNGGGHPGMVALLSSYLFDNSNPVADTVHLNTFHWRDGREQQSWTLPYVPGRRLGEVPVWVLTSDRTFSGGEEFAYNLQTRRRATVVGETTAGGAHPGMPHRITPHIAVLVPSGRPVSPVTSGNWEGIGVRPDIAVPAAEALARAHAAALRAVLSRLGEPATGPNRALADEARRALAEYLPHQGRAEAGG
jgi:hypothetical protein